jgi:hypothetical protein
VMPKMLRGLEVELAVRLKGNRLWVLLLGMTASLFLMAFVTIRTLHQTEKREPLTAIGQSQPMLSPNGQLKGSEDQFLTIAAQNRSTEAQAVAGQGVSESDLIGGQRDARESAAKLNVPSSNRASAPNKAKVAGIRNEPRGINTKMIEPELHSLTPPEEITGLRNENQKQESKLQVHSVVHGHVVGNCQGMLIIDGKSIAFVPSGNSKDEFKSSLSEIIGIEAGNTLKIKFRNRTYHFKANTSKDKEANRAEVEAIYRELTRFTE